MRTFSSGPMSVAISIEELGKRYRLGELGGKPTRITEALVDSGRRLARLAERRRSEYPEEIWALRHLVLDVPEGQALGVIGRNGSGKTTLLKLLARITEPTEGRATIRGRVGAVIDLATGFHQELTGGENIFLNGAILGMGRAEIRAKFDEIVAFAGVDDFIDTPVKRYSAGMKIRLGFSVAAHLEPEVLLIDEVLAVGDADFQRKCMGRMTEIGSSGRTVLFVSHNMNAVEHLCDRVIWLDQGSLVRDGEASAVVGEYLKNRTRTLSPVWEPHADAPNPDVRLHGIRLLDGEGTPRTEFKRTEPALVEFDVSVLRSDPRLRVGLDLATQEGLIVFRTFHDDLAGAGNRLLEPGRWLVRCLIPANLLNHGLYSINARIKINQFRWCVQEDDVLQLEIEDEEVLEGRDQARPGLAYPVVGWEAEPVSAAESSAERAKPATLR